MKTTSVSLNVDDIGCILASMQTYEDDSADSKEYNKMILKLEKKMKKALNRLGYQES